MQHPMRLNRVYGITIMGEICFVSIMHEGMPVLIGKKIFKNLDSVNLLQGESNFSKLAEYEQGSVLSMLLWSREVIRVAFPNELHFACVISCPEWMGNKFQGNVACTATRVGLLLLRILGNLGASTWFADRLQCTAASHRWLLVTSDHIVMTVALAEIGEGVNEMIGAESSIVPSMESSGEWECSETLNQLVAQLCNKLSIAQHSEIDYCLLCGQFTANKIEALTMAVAKATSISAQSVHYDVASVPLGLALQAGIMSGAVKDKLLVDIQRNPLSLRVEDGDPNLATCKSIKRWLMIGANETILLGSKRENIPLEISGLSSLRLVLSEQFLYARNGCETSFTLYSYRISNLRADPLSASLGVEVYIAVDGRVDLRLDLGAVEANRVRISTSYDYTLPESMPC